MRHRGLIEALVHTFEFDQVARGLDLRRGLIAVYGVAEGHKSLVMAAVHRLSSQPVVVVASDSEAALRIRADLEVFFPGEVMYLPPWEFIPYKIYAQSLDNVNLRVSVWRRLVVDPPAFIVTTAEALIQRVVPLDVWKEAAVYLETGRTYLLEELTAAFSCLGYERVPLVEVPGQMSVRGGILDIFPLGEANPLRLEFDGDELVSIRRFSVDDQLSREETKEALVFPARELVCNGKVMERGIARLREECSRISQRLAHGAKTEAGMRLKEKLESYISDLEAGRYPEGCEQFLLYFFPEAGTILDHFSHQTVVILDEPKRIEDSIRGKLKDHAGCMSELVAGGVVLPGQVDIYISGEEVGKKLSCYPAISLSLLPHNSNDFPAQRAVKWESRAPGSCFGQLDRLVEEVSAWRSKRYRCFFFIDTRDRAVRLKEALLSYGIEAPLVKDVRGAVPEGQILIVSGSLSGGFECPGAR
ncbi:MAG: hypothetical protein H5U03_02815, partial [Clostridia bacterium]|nr:hypothetical protein [Clostridia bacterium]